MISTKCSRSCSYPFGISAKTKSFSVNFPCFSMIQHQLSPVKCSKYALFFAHLWSTRTFCKVFTKTALPNREGCTKHVQFSMHLTPKLPTYPLPDSFSRIQSPLQVWLFIRVLRTTLQNTLQNLRICIGPKYYQRAEKGRRFWSDLAYGQLLRSAGHRLKGDIAWHQRPAARICQIVLHRRPARNMHHRPTFQMTCSPPGRPLR